MHTSIVASPFGMTPHQRPALKRLLINLAPQQVHHGDRPEVDDGIGELAHALGIQTTVHPSLGLGKIPGVPDTRSRNLQAAAANRRKARTPRARIEAMVDEADVTIILPFQMNPQPSVSTWHASDYAIESGRWLIVIFPNGIITEMLPDGTTEHTDSEGLPISNERMKYIQSMTV